MNTPNIKITPSAVEAIRERLEQSSLEKPCFRLGVKGGSCQGFAYHLEIVNDSFQDKDLVLEQGDIKLVVDKKSMKLLEGMTLDYERNMMSSFFKFDNPNVTSSCGCKMSFNIG